MSRFKYNARDDYFVDTKLQKTLSCLELLNYINIMSDSKIELEKENAELKKKKASLVLIIKDVIQSCVDNDLLVTAKEIEKQLKEQGE